MCVCVCAGRRQVGDGGKGRLLKGVGCKFCRLSQLEMGRGEGSASFVHGEAFSMFSQCLAAACFVCLRECEATRTHFGFAFRLTFPC